MKKYGLLIAGIIALGSTVVWAQVSGGGSSSTSSQSSTSSSSSGQSSKSGSSQSSGSSAGQSGWVVPAGHKIFAVIYTPGENWDKNKPVFEQDLDGHIQNLQAMHGKGILLLGGPFMDNTGGESVIHAPNLDEAKKLVMNDESVKKGVIVPSVHEWMVVFRQGQKPNF